jgi:hypothetical protein
MGLETMEHALAYASRLRDEMHVIFSKVGSIDTIGFVFASKAPPNLEDVTPFSLIVPLQYTEKTRVQVFQNLHKLVVNVRALGVIIFGEASTILVQKKDLNAEEIKEARAGSNTYKLKEVLKKYGVAKEVMFCSMEHCSRSTPFLWVSEIVDRGGIRSFLPWEEMTEIQGSGLMFNLLPKFN